MEEPYNINMPKIFIIKEMYGHSISLRDDYRQAIQCALKKCKNTKAPIEVWERFINSDPDNDKPVATIVIKDGSVVTVLKDENRYSEQYTERCFE